jgi:hypothetical protein
MVFKFSQRRFQRHHLSCADSWLILVLEYCHCKQDTTVSRVGYSAVDANMTHKLAEWYSV